MSQKEVNYGYLILEIMYLEKHLQIKWCAIQDLLLDDMGVWEMSGVQMK